VLPVFQVWQKVSSSTFSLLCLITSLWSKLALECFNPEIRFQLARAGSPSQPWLSPGTASLLSQIHVHLPWWQQATHLHCPAPDFVPWVHPMAERFSTRSCPRRLPVAPEQQLLQPASGFATSQPMHSFYPASCLFAPKA